MTDPDPMTENLTIVAVAIIAIAITMIVTENVPAVLIGAVNIVETGKPPDHHPLRVTDANARVPSRQVLSIRWVPCCNLVLVLTASTYYLQSSCIEVLN